MVQEPHSRKWFKVELPNYSEHWTHQTQDTAEATALHKQHQSKDVFCVSRASLAGETSPAVSVKIRQ